MTADRHKQNSNKILTLIHCGMSVPDTRGEVKDDEGPAGERAGDAGGADGIADNDVVKLEQLTMEGGRAGHPWYSGVLVTGPGTWQMETVQGELGQMAMEGELGMVQMAMEGELGMVQMAMVRTRTWSWGW